MTLRRIVTGRRTERHVASSVPAYSLGGPSKGRDRAPRPAQASYFTALLAVFSIAGLLAVQPGLAQTKKEMRQEKKLQKKQQKEAEYTRQVVEVMRPYIDLDGDSHRPIAVSGSFFHGDAVSHGGLYTNSAGDVLWTMHHPDISLWRVTQYRALDSGYVRSEDAVFSSRDKIADFMAEGDKRELPIFTLTREEEEERFMISLEAAVVVLESIVRDRLTVAYARFSSPADLLSSLSQSSRALIFRNLGGDAQDSYDEEQLLARLLQIGAAVFVAKKVGDLLAVGAPAVPPSGEVALQADEDLSTPDSQSDLALPCVKEIVASSAKSVLVVCGDGRERTYRQNEYGQWVVSGGIIAIPALNRFASIEEAANTWCRCD